MVTTTKILSSQKADNMIQTCDKVVGQYASYATEIPENSFFYETSVMDASEMPNSSFDDIPDDCTYDDCNQGYGILITKKPFDHCSYVTHNLFLL